MNLVELIILAIAQGLTEFIPVSSSGHLVALEKFFESESSIALEILLHVGTLFALGKHFYSKIMAICKATFVDRNIHLLRNLFVSTIPVVVVGFLIAALFDDTSWRSVGLVSLMLIVVGVLMLFVDRFTKTTTQTIEKVTLQDAAIVGLFQALSVVPGTSRSGITMIGARMRGMAYDVAAEYSFLLAIPALIGATLYVLVSDGISALNKLSALDMIIAVLVSGLVGLAAIRIMLQLLSKFGFAPFAYYRIVLGITLLFLL